MRLFAGIPLADEVVEELAKMTARLRRKEDGLRWSAAEGWHVTLQFLGSVDAERYECVVARLREVRGVAVPVRLEGVGFFERAGVFFAGVRVSPELVALQRRVTAATERCGFVPEDRPYHPHVTLARSKGRERERAMRALKTRVTREAKFSEFVAEEFLLYESFSEPGGSRYEVRERFLLSG
jgi:2'-5' RNA ligase